MTSPRRGLTSTHGTSTGQEDPFEGAPCRSVDPELFFPDGRGIGSQYPAYVEARQVCGPCPVRRECLRRPRSGASPGACGAGNCSTTAE
jgi:hypothetical protein